MTAFSKVPKTYAQQLQILKDRGLEVPDKDFALHCLEHLNYYRLSAYRFTFLKAGSTEEFEPGTTFTDLWTLYDFDQTLRRLVIDASKRVEVSVRSRWAYTLAHKYGAFAFEDPSHFKNANGHQGMLNKLDEELARSTEDFVTHFTQNHGLTRPPIWAACEVFSFGLMSRFYKSLRRSIDRLDIARTYGLDEKILASFLHHLATVRNHAAHHGRVWNRSFTVAMTPPLHPPHLAANFLYNPATAERRIYNTLTMLVYMLSVIEPGCPIPRFLYQTLDQADPSYHGHMGFPADWKSRALWQALAPPPPPSPAPATSTTGGTTS